MKYQGILYKGARIEIGMSSARIQLLVNGEVLQSCLNANNSSDFSIMLSDGSTVRAITSPMGLTKAKAIIMIDNRTEFEGVFKGLW